MIEPMRPVNDVQPLHYSPSGIVKAAYGVDVPDEFIVELLINCTAFPFAPPEVLRSQVEQLFNATGGSTDLDALIGYSMAQMDAEWEQFKLTDEYINRDNF